MNQSNQTIPKWVQEVIRLLEADECVDSVAVKFLNQGCDQLPFGDVIVRFADDDLVVSWAATTEETRVLFEDLVFEGVLAKNVPDMVSKLIRGEVDRQAKGKLIGWRRVVVTIESIDYASDWVRRAHK